MGAPLTTSPMSGANGYNLTYPFDDTIEDESDQWEYEYDENETEDFYITLDVSAYRNPHERNPEKGQAAANGQSSGAKRKHGGDEDGEGGVDQDQHSSTVSAGDVYHQSGDRGGSAAKRRRPSQPDDRSSDDDDDHQIPGQDAANPSPSTTSPFTNSGRQIQILDLHTAHPYFLAHSPNDDDDTNANSDTSTGANGHAGPVSALSWSTDLGTQFLLSAPKSIINGPVRRRGYKTDVVALSRVRLTAHPLILQPKKGLPGTSTKSGVGKGDSRDQPINIDYHHNPQTHDRDPARAGDSAAAASTGDREQEQEQEQTHSFIPDQAIQDLSAEAAAEDAERTRNFRLRLAEIKRRKGETDRVPLGGILDYGARGRQGFGGLDHNDDDGDVDGGDYGNADAEDGDGDGRRGGRQGRRVVRFSGVDADEDEEGAEDIDDEDEDEEEDDVGGHEEEDDDVHGDDEDDDDNGDDNDADAGQTGSAE